MSNYVKTVDFAAKDALATGNPNKVALGAQVDTELSNISTAIATKQDTSAKGQANGYASLDSSGEIPDDQLSSDIARLSEGAIFTGANGNTGAVVVSSTAPIYGWIETDGPTDEKRWRMYTSNGAWNLQTLTDADTSGAFALTISRTGTTVDSINLQATSVQINSDTIWHAGNDGSGSTLDADTVDGNHASAFATASHNHSATEITSGTLPIARGGTGNTGGVARNISSKTGTAKTLSTSAPSGGADGDIWYRYS